MDRSEQIERIKLLQSKYEKELLNKAFKPSRQNIRVKIPDTSVEDEVLSIFRQRKKHRTVMFIFLLILISIITLAFLALLALKIYFKINNNIEVISDFVLNIIAVSFFTQLITVVVVITKELWNEKGFLASPIIREMHRDNHKKNENYY